VNHRRERCFFVLCLCWLVFTLTIGTSGQALEAKLDELSPDDAARLQSQIERGSKEEKRTALSEIRNLRSASASRIALPALRDKDEVVRATAASSVIFLPREDAARAVVPLLDDKAEFVRREAAYALGEIGHSLATAPLVKLIRSNAMLEVRTAAAVGVGKIGDTSAIEGLIGVLRSTPREDEEFLRRSAARSVGQIAQIKKTGERSVLTPQNFLPDKFKDLGPESSGVRIAEFAAAVDVLIAVLRNNSESDDTRREAAFALGAIGDAHAIPALQTNSSASDPYLAEICREALLKIERTKN
jgi:HEAT repeat protein